MAKTSFFVTARPRRASPILICRKCLRRVEDGKQIKRLLKAKAKSQGQEQSLKPARVVMTSCFGICPKHAVVVVNAVTLQRGEYLLVSDSKSAEAAAALLMPAEKAR
jgi:predicted metal-binding protein